ncbi:uncharacterized protein LOC104887355 [Beta vulgaris subsp. vulgaris]|uniref:uncharacterized protein LOC104887355 n=1 Tax=Beta vulgaris subsp. vulgaris TaxID=3555 RepID=UPI00053FD2D9|nr:uncharacterized protein LOC104887355 [Beta vulgaris subsp. vulgaris]
MLEVSTNGGDKEDQNAENSNSFSGSIFNVSASYNDPFFISNSDQTMSKLVVVNLNGNNYISWKRNIRRALIAKNKIGFVEGSIAKPEENDKNYNQWMCCDYLIICWLMNSMNEDIGENFTFVESSAQLWNEIAECYGQSNGPQIYQLTRELDNLRQENQSIMVYYGKLKKCWDELQNLRSMPSCTCGILSRCSCNFLKRLSEFESEEKLMQFLLGLNSGFDNAISNILAMDPLPPISRAYYLAQQVEKQKEVSGLNHRNEVSALLAHKQPFHAKIPYKKDWRKEKTDRVCEYCKKQGHTKYTCFKLNGFPDWFNKKYGNNSSYGGNSYGSSSKLVANVAVEDYGLENDPLEFNMAGPANYTNDNAAGDKNGSIYPVMFQNIMQEVMKVMKGKQGSGESSQTEHSFANCAGKTSSVLHCNTWIIDSRATDHMIFDDQMLINKRKLVKMIEVGLPDGSKNHVSVIGDVMITVDLMLRDVLFVPCFQHNLISIGKLALDSSIEVVFKHNIFPFYSR